MIIRFLASILLVFLLPVFGAAAWWSTVDRPSSWRSADWGSSGLLDSARSGDDAAIYVLAARTGGFKGAFAVHSWIVIKEKGSAHLTRFDKVGWGTPVRQDSYPADAYWYSNAPYIVAEHHGADAERLIPHVQAAIAAYPFNQRGDYQIWPGPNSNTFVAHVLRSVPAMEAELPPHATGRDYIPAPFFVRETDGSDIHFSLFGLAGFSIGKTSGFEIHLLGQALGIDFRNGALKVPAFGRISWS